MRKNLKVMLVTVMVLVMLSAMPVFGATYAPSEVNVYVDSSIEVYVDSERVYFNTPCVIENGNTLVQMRPILQALGYYIEWDQEKKIALMVEDVGNGYQLGTALKINDNVAKQFYFDQYMNMLGDGPADITMNNPARLINGTTMVPVRFVGELTGRVVTWYPDQRIIDIREPNYVDNSSDYLQDYNMEDYDQNGNYISDEQRKINEQYVELFDAPVDQYPGAFQ
jgi:hypothetical protein